MTPLVRRCAAPLSLAVAAGLLVSAPAQAAPTWLEPVNVDRVTANYPEQTAVDVDALGAATAVWASWDDNLGNYSLRTSSHPVGGTWSAPVPLSGRLDDVQFDLAVGASGDAVAAWIVGDNESVEAVFRPAGGSWSTPASISAGSTESRNLHVGMDAAGNASVVWDVSDITSEHVDLVTATRTSGWTSVAPINGSLGASRSDLAVAPDGAATVVWGRHDDDIDVGVVEAVNRTSAAEPFGAAQVISDTDFPAQSPVVSVNASGAAAAAWAQPTGAEYSRVRAAIRPVGGAWVSSPPLSSTPDTTFESDEAFADKIVVDGTGAPTLVWIRSVDLDPSPDRDIERTVYAAAATADGSWSAPSLLGEYRNDEVSLGVDASGTTTASWNSSGSGTSNVVRRPAGGAWSGAMAVDSQASFFSGGVSTAVAPSGDVVATWSSYDPADDLADTVRSRAYDVDGPLVNALSVPGTGTAGTPVAFSVTAVDAWSAVASTSWSFGDGTTASGAGVSHTYANAGTYSVSVTVTDAVGNAHTRTGTTVVAAVPVVTLPAAPKPTLTGVKLTKKTIHVLKSDEKPRATKLKLTLNTDAKVTVKLKRTKKVDAKTVKAKVATSLKAGNGAIKLTSKVGGTKLPAGTYKIKVTATSSVGTSAATTVKLTIKN